MSEPKVHHYVPVFYLSRWHGPDKRICRFNRPYGNEVRATRVVPKGTAFEPGLYTSHGSAPERAQTMERDFLANVDDNAAKALVLLENGLPNKSLTIEARNSWSEFLVTQMLRAPRDIAQIKSSVEQEWNIRKEALKKSYAASRSSSDPATFDEYILKQNPAHEDEFVFSILRRLMVHPPICQLLNNMHWSVFEIPQECDPLLTSDHPIWMTLTLKEDDDFLMTPIGPRRLFAATLKPETQGRFQSQRRGDLVKKINEIVVRHAEKFVYGQTDDMLSFVQKYMSSRRHSTLLERLAAIHGHEIVAPDCPLNRP